MSKRCNDTSLVTFSHPHGHYFSFTEVKNCLFVAKDSNIKMKATDGKHNMPAYCTFGVIQVSGRLGALICIKTTTLTSLILDKILTVASWTALMSTFKDKLDCSVFWLLGWHHMSSMEIYCIFLQSCFLFMLESLVTVGVWNSLPS